MLETVKPLSEEVYLEDDFAFLHPILRGFFLYLKSFILSVGIFILAIILPIPIGLLNATLQLFRLKPLQALKSVLGGIFACASLIIIACLGAIPLVLKKIVSSVFLSKKGDFYGEEINPVTGIDKGSGISKRPGNNAILTTTCTPSTQRQKSRIRFPSHLDDQKRKDDEIPWPNTTMHIIAFPALAEGFYPFSILDAYQNCYVVFFRNPGVLVNDKINSSNDLINAGIQIVYDVIKRNNWTPAEIEKYLRLEGRSLGGGVAYHVALHFKKHHGIDIHVDGQNTFDSLSSVFSDKFKLIFNLPLWCSHIFCKMILSAGGGFEIDTLAAALQLNPKYIHFSNVKYVKKYPKMAKSFFEKVDNFFWGPHDYYPDAVIGEASLYNGIKKVSQKNQHLSSTYYDYFQILDFKSNKAIHRVEKSKPRNLREALENHEHYVSYMEKQDFSGSDSMAVPPRRRR